MSEGGYQELDLDNPGKPGAKGADSDLEIVHEGLETPEVEIVEEAAAPPAKPAPAETEADDEDDSSPESSASERRKLTRSQRLKAQRDAYARQLADAQARLQALETRAARAEADANEGAAIGFDLYIKQLDTSMQALRREFDSAFDAGDRDKIFEVQQKIASITAAKAQAEKERRSIPTKASSGQATQPQTTPTQSKPAARKAPTPAALEWYERNKTWFNKDVVMTAGARVIDQQMVRDGYAPDDPDYFEELDKRLKAEFPAKLGGRTQAAAPARQASNPTIQNRGAPAPNAGKIRVTITQADREMAGHLGISVEDYAREKARAERAQQTASQYTEIL